MYYQKNSIETVLQKIYKEGRGEEGKGGENLNKITCFEVKKVDERMCILRIIILDFPKRKNHSLYLLLTSHFFLEQVIRFFSPPLHYSNLKYNIIHLYNV